MDAIRYWPVVVETPSGEKQTCVVAYPRKPTEDLAAGLVRHQLGMNATPERYRYLEDASLKLLESAGYRLLEVGGGKSQ